MLWLKKNWLWLAVNIIAIVLLVSTLNNFSFDFSDGIVPTVTIEQSSFDGPDRLPFRKVGGRASGRKSRPGNPSGGWIGCVYSIPGEKALLGSAVRSGQVGTA